MYDESQRQTLLGALDLQAAYKKTVGHKERRAQNDSMQLMAQEYGKRIGRTACQREPETQEYEHMCRTVWRCDVQGSCTASLKCSDSLCSTTAVAGPVVMPTWYQSYLITNLENVVRIVGGLQGWDDVPSIS
jgi:hypothetical protein